MFLYEPSVNGRSDAVIWERMVHLGLLQHNFHLYYMMLQGVFLKATKTGQYTLLTLMAKSLAHQMDVAWSAESPGVSSSVLEQAESVSWPSAYYGLILHPSTYDSTYEYEYTWYAIFSFRSERQFKTVPKLTLFHIFLVFPPLSEHVNPASLSPTLKH